MRVEQHTSDRAFEPRPSASNTPRVIALEGRVGPATVMMLHRHLSQRLGAGCSRVVIDLGGVTAIGTQTLTLLCGALRQLSHQGATTAIAGADHRVRRVIRLYAIEHVTLRRTLDAAPAVGALPSGAGAD